MEMNKPIPDQEQVNIPPTTGVPVSQKPTTRKPIAIWFLAILVVTLLEATGVFAYKYYELKRQVDQQPTSSIPPAKVTTASPSPALSPSSSTVTDPTANWKKIQIKDLNVDPGTRIGTRDKGLEIKYPKDWFHLSGENLGGTGAGDFIMSFQSNMILEDVPKEDIQIQIFLLLPPKEGLHEFVNNYQSTGLTSPTKIIINNFEGYKGKTNKEIKHFLKIDENNIAHIYVTPNDSDLIEVFEQILSTFKFTN